MTTWPDDGGFPPRALAAEAWPPLVLDTDVTRWTGPIDNALAKDAAALATAYVRAYCTRGLPDPAPVAVRGVALALAIRLAKNPQALRTISVEGQSYSPAPTGFTFLESLLLNRYRRRTA